MPTLYLLSPITHQCDLLSTVKSPPHHRYKTLPWQARGLLLADDRVRNAQWWWLRKQFEPNCRAYKNVTTMIGVTVLLHRDFLRIQEVVLGVRWLESDTTPHEIIYQCQYLACPVWPVLCTPSRAITVFTVSIPRPRSLLCLRTIERRANNQPGQGLRYCKNNFTPGRGGGGYTYRLHYTKFITELGGM